MNHPSVLLYTDFLYQYIIFQYGFCFEMFLCSKQEREREKKFYERMRKVGKRNALIFICTWIRFTKDYSILLRRDQIDFMHTKNGSYHMLIDYLNNIKFNIFIFAYEINSCSCTVCFSSFLFFLLSILIINWKCSNRYGKNINCSTYMQSID